MTTSRTRLFIRGTAFLWATAVLAQTPFITSGPDYGTYPVGPTQIPLTASGGTPPYTWSVTGTLPGNLSIRTDKPNWFPPDATAGLIGVTAAPQYNPPVSFTLTVTDSLGHTGSQTATFKIIPLAVLDNWQLPDAFLGVPYSYVPVTSGASGSVTWAVPPGQALPPGFLLNASTGAIYGTPTAKGFYSFSISATDSNGSVWKNFQIGVFGVGFATSGDLGNATVGQSFAATFAGTGGTPPYQYSAPWLPPGVSLSPSGLMFGTITGGNGTWRFSVTVTDSTGATYNKQFALAILGTPTLPSLGYPNPADDATVGEPRSYGFSVNNGKSPYTWSTTGSLPPGMVLRTTNATPYVGPIDAEIEGTPASTTSPSR